MYDPLTNQYSQIRHEELMREVDAFWRMELARQERGEKLPAEAPRKASPLNRLTHLLATIIR
jgi:hypothetical protein